LQDDIPVYPSSAANDDLDAGLNAYNAKKYDEAFQAWKRSATAGHPMAMYNLGYLYESGQGVSADYNAAILWYQEAAATGLLRAKFAVRNVKAHALVLKAEGSVGAGRNADALSALREAAALGSGPAMLDLAGYYTGSYSGQTDVPQALQWAEKAAMYGADVDPDFTAMLRTRLIKIEDVKAGTAALAAKDYAQAATAFATASKAGNPDGMYGLAVVLETRTDGKKDMDEALNWYDRAASLGFNLEARKAANRIRGLPNSPATPTAQQNPAVTNRPEPAR
jgi:TPR repeat protein